jgi:hypothetical protein
MTGLPSYFFHPRHLPLEQQNRAVALSYYTCAPLACTPALFLLAWLGSGIDPRGTSIPSPDPGTAVVSVGLLILFLLWWQGLVVFTRRGMNRSTGGVALVAVGVPVSWLLIGVGAVVFVEAVVRLLGLMYFSLQE